MQQVLLSSVLKPITTAESSGPVSEYHRRERFAISPAIVVVFSLLFFFLFYHRYLLDYQLDTRTRSNARRFVFAEQRGKGKTTET